MVKHMTHAMYLFSYQLFCKGNIDSQNYCYFHMQYYANTKVILLNRVTAKIIKKCYDSQRRSKERYSMTM